MKLRDPNKSAALLFGDAMDTALNALLKNENGVIDVFNKKWEWNKVSTKEDEFIPDNPKIRYADSDLDKDLLTDEDIDNISQKAKELGFDELPRDQIVELCVQHKKDVGYMKMDTNEIKLFNFINWLSLKRKAPIMIKAYKEKIVPRIKKVHSVQKYIEMTNHDGDIVNGYIDLIVDFELDDGKVVKMIADNKTSTIEYAQDAVIKSQQLSIYCIAENIDYAGFFVIRKALAKNKTKLCEKCGYDGIKEDKRLTQAKTCDRIIENKRCNGKWTETINPEAKIDIRIDEIKKYNKEIVVDTLDQVTRGIKNEIFPRNYQSCESWGGCVYKDLCFYNKKDSLIEDK